MEVADPQTCASSSYCNPADPEPHSSLGVQPFSGATELFLQTHKATMARRKWEEVPQCPILPHWGFQVKYLLMQMDFKSPCPALGHHAQYKSEGTKSLLSHTM